MASDDLEVIVKLIGKNVWRIEASKYTLFHDQIP